MWVQIFGSTAESTAVVLAMFMLGLGLGAAGHRVLGRLLRARGIQLYVRLELVVVVGALVMPWLMGWADATHLAAARSWGLESGALDGLRVGLAALLLLPPTLCMGATIPALAEEIHGAARSPEAAAEAEGEVARLYAWNTAGAVLGVLLGGFVIIPFLGLRATLWAAAAAELLAAAYAENHRLEGAEAEGGDEDTHDRAEEESPPEASRPWALAVYALVGFWGMVLELVGIRILLAVTGSTSAALAAVLAAFLTGIAMGAAWTRRPADRPPEATLGLRLLGAGVVVAGVAAALPLLDHLYLSLAGLGSGWVGGLLATVGIAALLLLPIGFALGTLFPAATRCLMAAGAADAVGRAYLVNSVAGAAGSLLAFRVVVAWAGLSGAFFWHRAGRLALALAIAMPVLGRHQVLRLTRTASRMLASLRAGAPVEKLLAPQSGELRWYRDGADASVGVRFLRDGNRSLIINGKSDADLKHDMQAQVSLGLVPALLADEGADVLLFGLGAGGSADAALRTPIGSLAVGELLPSVHEASSRAFRDVFPRPYEDPRSRILHVDGRLLVRAWPEKVDLICSEPTNLYVQGVANLYTTEFFAACRDRLKAGGRLVQWIQAYDLDEEALRMTVRSLLEVFPHLTLAWFDDFFFLAGDQPLVFPVETLRERMAAPGVREALRRAGIPPLPEQIAGRFVAGTEALRDWAGEGPQLTDDLPALEFRTDFNRFRPTLPDFERILAGIRLQPRYDRVLPLTDLLRPTEGGGQVLRVARLRLAAGLPEGQARVVRLDDPRKGLLGINAPKVVHWSGEAERGSAQVRVFPGKFVPDPKQPLEALGRDARGPVALRRATAQGHGAWWIAVETAKGHQARLAWLCPVTMATYVLDASAEDGDDVAWLAHLADRVACDHGPGAGPPPGTILRDVP
jgi:spermidine synthase